MSLKAKLEAVIYAAEEPVTLAQLAALFAANALEWKAQQEALSAEQAAEADDVSAQPIVNEQFDYLEPVPVDSVQQELMSAPDAEQEQNQSNRALDKNLKGGFYFHPSDEDLSLGTPVTTPSSKDRSLGTPDRKKPLEGSASGYSYSDFAIAAEAATETSPEASHDNSPTEDSTNGETDPAEADETAAAEIEARRIARQRDREARAIIRQLLDELIASSASDGHGVEIREIAGGYRMATKPEYHDAVRLFVKSLKPALKLSLPALETLAVIAYKQPVTAPEVNEIRGVDSSAVFGTLLARKLIATAGRKPVIGRPILYKTTREFLLRFGLKDVTELPSMEEFEKMATLELDEPEPAMDGSEQRSNPALGLEFDEAASEELEDSPSEELESETETPEATTTAETAAGNEPPPPAQAAPAEPPRTKQAETENSPHGDKEH